MQVEASGLLQIVVLSYFAVAGTFVTLQSPPLLALLALLAFYADILAVSAGEAPRGPRRADDPKMVFVVNHSLKMGIGKTASQVAHAAVLLYQQLQVRESDVENLFRWHDIGCVEFSRDHLPHVTCESSD